MEDFASFYKKDLVGKIDKKAKEGTGEIFDQVVNKENKSSHMSADFYSLASSLEDEPSSPATEVR